MPTTYYVSAAGLNANDGLSTGTPFLTLAKAQTVAVQGDTVRLRGGDTFAESVTFTVGVTVNSYGTGQATVAPAGNLQPALKFANCGGITVDNLTVIGANNGTPVTTSDPDSFRPAGVEVLNDGGGTTKYTGVTLTNLTVTGFVTGLFGYADGGTTSGYDQVTITDNVVHDCKAFGIFTWSSSTSRVARFTNATISRNVVHDIPGYGVRISGIPITPGFIQTGTVADNIVYNSGSGQTFAGSGGPGGIVAVYCDGVVISRCEAYGIHHSTSNADGIGIDLDIACVNCRVEGCYTHGNDGPGIYLFSDGGGNVVRFNVSVDDARGGAWGLIQSNGSTAANDVYNNTVVINTQNGSNNAVGLYNATGSAATHFWNNIVSVPASTIAIAATGTSTTATAQGNVIFQRTGTAYSLLYYWNNVGYSTLAAFRTGTGQENQGGTPRGFQTDPGLYGPLSPVPTAGSASAVQALTNYRLAQTSTVIGAGLNLAALFSANLPATDMSGATLPGSGYSPGAVNAAVSPAPSVSPSSSATSTGATLAANLTGGQSPFTYAWSGTGLSFSNSAVANPTATVAAAGTYTATLIVTDANSATATGSTSFTVTQVKTTVTVSPSSVSLANAATQTFAAAVADQFGNAISSPAVTWSYAPGGSVNASTGVFTQAGGTVTATSGSATGAASVLPGSVATYANAADVRLNVDRGDGTLGTLDLPLRNHVDSSVTFDNGTKEGTLILPPASAVLETAYFGIGAGTTGGDPGTVHLPTTAQVVAGVGFGPGNSLTGTATGSGGDTIIFEDGAVITITD